MTTKAYTRHLGLLLTLACALGVSACGSNIFATGEAKDPAEDATIALDDDNPTKAIDILESALADDPENGRYLSILSTAYAQRAGVDLLSFARSLAPSGDDDDDSGEGGGDSSSAGITQLWGVMPEATDDVLSDIDRAVLILTTEIPADQHQPGDTFKLGLYQMASISLHTKALDTDGDGALSPEEILDLSSASAASLLLQLASAGATLATGEGDTSQAAAAERVASYQAAIEASPGDTQEDKLRNYLAATNSDG